MKSPFPIYDKLEEDLDIARRYEKLREVLEAAFTRASVGKGAMRHVSEGEKFEDQAILRLTRLFGVGGVQFQIAKKIEEINNIEDLNGKTSELLDVIVYAAAGVIYLEEKKE